MCLRLRPLAPTRRSNAKYAWRGLFTKIFGKKQVQNTRSPALLHLPLLSVLCLRRVCASVHKDIWNFDFNFGCSTATSLWAWAPVGCCFEGRCSLLRRRSPDLFRQSFSFQSQYIYRCFAVRARLWSHRCRHFYGPINGRIWCKWAAIAPQLDSCGVDKHFRLISCRANKGE